MKLLTYGLTLSKKNLQSQLLTRSISCKKNYNSKNYFTASNISQKKHTIYLSGSRILQNCYINKNHPNQQFYKNNLISVRLIQTGKSNKSPKTPDLIYVPHVLRWLKTKFRFKYLQKAWDPEFSEGAFIYGTTQAVCRITEIIHEEKVEDLEGLLTKSAKIKLQDDIATKLTKVQIKIIKIKPEDIKILVPISVNLRNEGFNKLCEVSLRSLALKWFEERGNLKLVLVALQTEFMRDYTNGNNTQWIISTFEILECAMLSESSTVR